jgi:hypothetical protein
MKKIQAEIDPLNDKASQVDISKEQVAFLLQMQMQNSMEKYLEEAGFTGCVLDVSSPSIVFD